MKSINLVVEDSLSEAILRCLLKEFGVLVGPCYGLKGNDYIKKKVRAFYGASQYVSYLVLTDLDSGVCPSQLVSDWLPNLTPCNDFIFRVAVREVESWLLADKSNFAKYLGVSVAHIPSSIEEIENPKEFLIALAKRSRKREIREDIAPPIGSICKRGRNYNGSLIKFIQLLWDYKVASNYSKSLKGTVNAIKKFAKS